MSSAAEIAPLASLSRSLSALVEKVSHHTVSIVSHRARSSGFLWKKGLIVTADEALADSGDVSVVFPGGKTVPATIVGRDPTTDIALLRVESDATDAVKFASQIPNAGSLAIVTGSEGGEAVSALGTVSRSGGAWQSMRGGQIDARIEMDVSLRRNAEGSLAVSADGDIFGMAVLGPRRRVLVIPAATINRVAAQLETTGRIAHGYLGLGLQPVAVSDDGKNGAIVLTVDPAGPGKAAGMLQGDVIVLWNNEPVDRLRKLIRSLGPESVGQKISVGIKRASEMRTVELTVGERPAD
jgi:S1-C subfamily serine protease